MTKKVTTPKKTELVKLPEESRNPLFLLSSLQQRYDGFIKAPEREFFIGIADYIKYIAEIPELEAIASQIKNIQRSDEEKISGLEKRVMEDIEKTALEVFTTIKTENLRSDELTHAIDQYQGIIDDRIQSSAQKEEALWEALTRIISVIHETGQKQSVQHLIKVDPESGYITDFNISPSYGDYLEELKLFRDKRRISIWGSWDNLVLVYLVIHQFNEEMQRLAPNKFIWQRMNFIGLYGEMEKILNNNKTEYRIHFQQEPYKTYVSRIHNFFAEELSKKAPMKILMEEAAKSMTIPSILPLAAQANAINQLVRAQKLASEQLSEMWKNLGSVSSLQKTIEEIQSQLPLMGQAAKDFGKASEFAVKIKESQNFLKSLPVIPQPKDLEYRKVAAEAIQLRAELEQMKKEMEEMKRNQEQNKRILTKKEWKNELKEVIKTRRLGKKGKRFLMLLSDFEPKTLKHLASGIPTPDCKHIKEYAQKKLKGTGWTIQTIKAAGFIQKDSFYQLFSPYQKTEKDL